MLVFRYDPSFMEKKPPEKSFQTKILKMAVKSDQVGIERKSKMQNFAWVKKVFFSFQKHISTTKGSQEKWAERENQKLLIPGTL